MSDGGYVGVIGAGSFGTAIANLLCENSKVILKTRTAEQSEEIKKTRLSHNQTVNESIEVISNNEELADKCPLIFPTVPSANFREMMRDLSPFLQPHHILIHGTKGLDVQLTNNELLSEDLRLKRADIMTMSEVIQAESIVKRVGSLAGPNLAGEIAAKQPAGAVIASRFDEVINEGQKAIRSARFQIYRNHDLLGVEFSGALKNIIAIAAGALSGLGLGENARALLVTKGMGEMLRIGVALGADKSAFLGLAGIGDLMATCTSPLSRNYTVGHRLALGESLSEILASMNEVAEGVKTVKIVKALSEQYNIGTPLVNIIHRVLFKDLAVETGLELLMKYPYDIDVDFL